MIRPKLSAGSLTRYIRCSRTHSTECASIFSVLLQVEQLQPITTFLPGMVQTLVTLGFYGFYLFSQANTRFLSIIALSYLPLYFLYTKLMGNFELKWQLPSQKAMIDEYSALAEVLLNVPTIKAFNGYKSASQSFVAQVECACFSGQM